MYCRLFPHHLFMHKRLALVLNTPLKEIMKKVINSILIAIVPMFFFSCIDESAPTVVAGVDSTSASEVFGGYTLDLNPTIVFAADGLTGTYNNSANDSGFPAGTNIQVVIKYVDGGVGLDITFTADAFTDGALGVTVQDFKDTGNDGGIDEFTVSAAKVGEKPIRNFKPVVQRPMPGEMKRSKADLAANPVAGAVDAAVAQQDVDISGAPTLAEWNSNIVGNAFLVTGSDGDLDLISFESSTTGSMYGLSGEDNGIKETFTYTYSYDNQNEGTIFYKGAPYPAGNYYPGVPAETSIQWTSDIDLKFTDWYNGTYTESQGKDTIVGTGDVIYQDTSPASGSFSVIKDVNVYVQKNFTANTNN
jgi:hypothetical protein